MKTVRCTSCRSEFSDKEIENATCCPTCKSTGVPQAISEDVTIKINWHELRILGIWAEHHAERIDKESGKEDNHNFHVVNTICRAVEKQFPLKTPLTLSAEFGQLKTLHPNIEIVKK